MYIVNSICSLVFKDPLSFVTRLIFVYPSKFTNRETDDKTNMKQHGAYETNSKNCQINRVFRWRLVVFQL